MTEHHTNSPQPPPSEGEGQAATPVPPHAHPGAPSWETPPPPGGVPNAPAHPYAPPMQGSQVPGDPPPGYRPAGAPTAAPGYGPQGGPVQVNAAPSFRSWQPGIIPLRPLNFGDFLTVPFRAMRYNRAVVLGAPLLFTLASTVLVLVTLWLVFNDPQLGLMSDIPALTGISWTSVAMIIVSLLAILLADVFSSSVIAPGVARAVLGERIGIAVAWRQVRRRLGSLLLLYLASSMVLTLFVVLSLSPLIVSLAGGEPDLALVLLSMFLFLLVMVPAGILVTLFQGVARAAIVLEGIPIGTALRRVMHLIRGRFWWSILILFVSSILINIVSSVLQYMGQFGFIAVAMIAPENMVVMAVSFMVIYGLSYVVSLVTVYSYLGSIFALMYIDMRMRREGFDLDLARAAEQRAGR